MNLLTWFVRPQHDIKYDWMMLAGHLLTWGKIFVSFAERFRLCEKKEKVMHQTPWCLTWTMWLGKSRFDGLRECYTVLLQQPKKHRKNDETGLAMENGGFSFRMIANSCFSLGFSGCHHDDIIHSICFFRSKCIWFLFRVLTRPSHWLACPCR